MALRSFYIEILSFINNNATKGLEVMGKGDTLGAH